MLCCLMTPGLSKDIPCHVCDQFVEANLSSKYEVRQRLKEFGLNIVYLSQNMIKNRAKRKKLC